MIGGLLGTKICGEEEIIGTKCQDIGVVFGVIGGAAAGTVTQAILGNHDLYLPEQVIAVDNLVYLIVIDYLLVLILLIAYALFSF